jgi:3-hydroxyacyl-CoA dehydrogenase
VFEEMGIKETVFRKLDEVMKPGAILASTLDVNRIAGFTGRPHALSVATGERHDRQPLPGDRRRAA